jgi:hypothetical protein
MSRHSIAKVSDLKHGRTLYMLKWGQIQQITVQHALVHDTGRYAASLHYTTSDNNEVTYRCLGDMAVPGYAYDKRGAQLYVSKRGALAALPKHLSWKGSLKQAQQRGISTTTTCGPENNVTYK